VVEHSYPNPEVKGLNPATEIASRRIWQEKINHLIIVHVWLPIRNQSNQLKEKLLLSFVGEITI
jgi:hypothetical protein